MFKLAGTVLVLLYFLPVFHTPDQLLPATFPDSWVFLWNIWRLGEVWEGTEAFYHTDLVFHPFSTGLALHTQAEGFLFPLASLASFFSPVHLFSLACCLCFLLNFLATESLLRAETESRYAGPLLALWFTFHPFFIGHLDGGHINFLCFFPIPIFFRIFLELTRGKKVGVWQLACMGLSYGSLPFLNLYYFYYVSLVVGIWLFLLLLLDPGRFVTVSKSLIFPVLLGILLSIGVLVQVSQAGMSRDYTRNHDPRVHSADLLHLALPTQNQLIGRSVPEERRPRGRLSRVEDGVYLGFFLLLFAVLVSRRGRRDERNRWTEISVAAIGFLLLLLSLGPYVQFGGERLFWNPFHALFRWLPFYPTVPIRIGFFGIFLLLIWFAQRIRSVDLRSLRGRDQFACVLFTALIAVEFAPVSVRSQPFVPSPALEHLSQSEEITAVHDDSDGLELRLVNQIIHHKPITATFLARRPRKPLRQYRRNKFLRFVRGRGSFALAEVREDFLILRIDAVIIPVSDSEKIAQVQKLPFLREEIRDDRFIIYVHSGEVISQMELLRGAVA